MFEILGSALTGGATGLIGTIATSVLGIYQKNKAETRQNAQQLAVMELSLKEAELEAKNRKEIAHIEADKAETEQEATLREASYLNDRATYSTSSTHGIHGPHKGLIWVDIMRGFVRPVMTYYALFICSIAYFLTTDPEMIKMFGEWMVYCSVTTFVWWFGERSTRKILK